MTLNEFIKIVGRNEVAKALDVTRQNVSYWEKFYYAVPPREAVRLIHLSNGRLTWESIYEPYRQHALKTGAIKKLPTLFSAQ